MNDPDDPTTQPSLFVDRVTESEALRRSLEQHRFRMDAGEVDSRALRNVLVFFGEGGVGKSELSRQLAGWLAGEPDPAAHWGPPPDVPVAAIVRWDANESSGGLDPLPLLRQLRSNMGAIKRTWSAFDLPFALFHRSLRPGEELRLRAPGKATTTLSEVAGSLGGDLFALTGTAVAGAAGAGVVTIGRNVVGAVRQRHKTAKLIATHPSLEQLLLDCESVSGSLEETAAIAGRLAFMLTREIDQMGDPEPAKRPLVVVFVDHMERLQSEGTSHLGEATLNRLISRLPYCLFVVTGRRSLRWHEVKPELPAHGLPTWPLLSTEHPTADEPRQHAIGNLHVRDAENFLTTSFTRHQIPVTADLAPSLAATTDGWPLHLHTIVTLARERSADNRPLTEDDLGGALPHLVERLLTDLPVDVARAFRAACLLPYFDEQFVAAAGQVDIGSVERLLTRQIVRHNETSTLYPNRVHDELRRIVRQAGSAVHGGWSEDDWTRHASLALDEAKRRFDDAMDADSDLLAVRSLALGLNVSTENNIFDPWLVDGIRRSPSIKGLAPLIAGDPPSGALPDVRDTLRFLRLRVDAGMVDVCEEMGELYRSNTAISSSAGVWRAYDLRKRGRTDAAVDQFEDLLRDHDDRPSLYRYQIVTTLRLARRYRDALDRTDHLTDQQKESTQAAIRRVHGEYDGAGAALIKRHEIASSRRFQIEIGADVAVARHREGGISLTELQPYYEPAIAIGHAGAQADCLGVMAEMSLFDDTTFSECIVEMERLSERNFQPYRSLPAALALRAYATSDKGLADRAHSIAFQCTYRSSVWTGVEILLEVVGRPLAPIESQWLEPYPVVKARWLSLYDRIIERARQSSGGSH